MRVPHSEEVANGPDRDITAAPVSKASVRILDRSRRWSSMYVTSGSLLGVKTSVLRIGSFLRLKSELVCRRVRRHARASKNVPRTIGSDLVVRSSGFFWASRSGEVRLAVTVWTKCDRILDVIRATFRERDSVVNF